MGRSGHFPTTSTTLRSLDLEDQGMPMDAQLSTCAKCLTDDVDVVHDDGRSLVIMCHECGLTRMLVVDQLLAS